MLKFKREEFCVYKYFFVFIICMLFSPIVTMAQEGEEPEEKVEKVTEKLLDKQEPTQSESHGHTEDKQMKKDFAEITKTVEKGTVPTVIKALSLAVFIAGLAILYLPKKKKEVSNG